MSKITLSGLYHYPVKSLRGNSLEQALLDERGIQFDRHWMLVDPDGGFITQRETPRMALVTTCLTADGLVLSAPGMADLVIPSEEGPGGILDVRIWGDRCRARLVPGVAGEWLSRFLGRDCRLVYLPRESRRPVDPVYAGSGDQVGFADGFPLLVISEASLEDLNSRLEQPLQMRRFRPNLVIRGCPPYAEDGWRRISIGGVGFRLVKNCSRCAITTIDPESGEKGREPLRTLSGYRRDGNKVNFGQNAIHDEPGRLELGMPVEIVECSVQ